MSVEFPNLIMTTISSKVHVNILILSHAFVKINVIAIYVSFHLTVNSELTTDTGYI